MYLNWILSHEIIHLKSVCCFQTVNLFLCFVRSLALSLNTSFSLFPLPDYSHTFFPLVLCS